MKVLILALGNLGATKRAGESLAFAFSESNNQITCISKIVKAIDFNNYDVVVFGTNVRMGLFNKEFKNQLKLFKQSSSRAKVYSFVLGARYDKKDKYEKKLSKLIGGGYSVFVGGELICEKANKFESAVINSIITYFVKHNIELPHIDNNKLEELAKLIEKEN